MQRTKPPRRAKFLMPTRQGWNLKFEPRRKSQIPLQRAGDAEAIGNRGGTCGWNWLLRFLGPFYKKGTKEPEKERIADYLPPKTETPKIN